MTINEYNNLITVINNNKTYFRKGQLAFNYLFAHFPKIANDIAGTDYDPFYEDVKLVAFLDKVLEYVR